MTSMPLGPTILARRVLSSGPQPASSSTERRRNNGLSAGQMARTASTISMQKRMRLSSLPP